MNKIVKMLPAMGFAIAVALVSITSAFKDAPKGQKNPPDLYEFRYVPPSSDPYSVENVEKVSNWTYDEGPTCPNGNSEACAIMASHVDNSGDEPVLLETENIVAAIPAGSSTARVNSTADGTGSSFITNRSN